MQNKNILFLLIAALVISAASAGGYAPIPDDPADHQTASQATAIAGAMVEYRGTYAPWLITPVNMDTRITTHRTSMRINWTIKRWVGYVTR